jgi:hypothetical protein
MRHLGHARPRAKRRVASAGRFRRQLIGFARRRHRSDAGRAAVRTCFPSDRRARLEDLPEDSSAGVPPHVKELRQVLSRLEMAVSRSSSSWTPTDERVADPCDFRQIELDFAPQPCWRTHRQRSSLDEARRGLRFCTVRVHMPFPKIPLPGKRVLTGHRPAPPANADPTPVQRFVSHLPLKVRAKKPEEGGRRPRAGVPQTQPIPQELEGEGQRPRADVPQTQPTPQELEGGQRPGPDVPQTKPAPQELEGGRQRPGADVSLLESMPKELLSKLAGYMNRRTWAAYRLVSRAAAANAAVVAKSVVVRRREDLISAPTAYKPGGITKLTAAHCELGDAEARHLAANTSITSLDLCRNKIGAEGAGGQHLDHLA